VGSLGRLGAGVDWGKRVLKAALRGRDFHIPSGETIRWPRGFLAAAIAAPPLPMISNTAIDVFWEFTTRLRETGPNTDDTHGRRPTQLTTRLAKQQ
jgi:hypothetical protein